MSYDIYKFLDELVRRDITNIAHQNAYFGAGAIAGGIEFLGACLDGYAIEEQGKSAARFCNAVNTLFPGNYRQFSRPSPFTKNQKPPHDLYTSLRCGMAHVCRPQGVFLTASLDQAASDGHHHLKVLSRGNKSGPLIIVEQFIADFDLAVLGLISRLRINLPAKLNGNILEVWDS
jgi:hypothetical protein